MTYCGFFENGQKVTYNPERGNSEIKEKMSGKKWVIARVKKIDCNCSLDLEKHEETCPHSQPEMVMYISPDTVTCNCGLADRQAKIENHDPGTKTKHYGDRCILQDAGHHQNVGITSSCGEKIPSLSGAWLIPA